MESAKKFILWLGDFVEDGSTGKPSVKRFGLALSVTVLSGVMLGLGAVVAYSAVITTGRDQVDIARIAADALVYISGLVLTAVSGSYVLDKALTRKKVDESIGKRETD